MQGIAELPTYARLANKLLSEDERRDLIDYLAEHPNLVDILVGIWKGRRS